MEYRSFCCGTFAGKKLREDEKLMLWNLLCSLLWLWELSLAMSAAVCASMKFRAKFRSQLGLALGIYPNPDYEKWNGHLEGGLKTNFLFNEVGTVESEMVEPPRKVKSQFTLTRIWLDKVWSIENGNGRLNTSGSQRHRSVPLDFEMHNYVLRKETIVI